MIAALFLNFGFLFVGGALVSVPIIIHLINRMRFKRIRWAAMEFLLKAQKRTRKRLIIEQLLLLMLRCLLIALVGLLVSRFIGCSDTNLTGKPNLHLVLLDDTLSMQDKGKAGNEAFAVAKEEILDKKIAKGLLQSKTSDKLVILPLSKVNDYLQVKAKLKGLGAEEEEKKKELEKELATVLKSYDRLNDKDRNDKLKQDIAKFQPSMLHVPVLDGLKAAKEIIADHSDTMVTLHVIGDYRHNDWAMQAGEGINKELLELVKKNPDVKVRLIDTVYPVRDAKQGGYPTANDNVGITDFHPSTRIAGKNMLVQFTVSVKNFSGKQVDVMLTARDESTGKDMAEVDFRPSQYLKLRPDSLTTVSFEQKFKPDLKLGESHFAHLDVRLTTPQMRPLDNDGLSPDNLRYAVVEVREKVPVLVIDSDPKGLEDSKDSFVIERALQSVTGASYDIVFGDKVAKGGPMAALELPSLKQQYPTIFMLNVPKLTPKQLARLESYVNDGGGVVFFMGRDVNINYYNRFLYKEGKGIFPAPLEKIFPAIQELPLEPKSQDTAQLLVRDEKFAADSVPIFSAMFEDPKVKATLADLPIRRYVKVDRNAWKPDTNKAVELATLPNDASIIAFQDKVVNEIARGAFVNAIRKAPEFAKYVPALDRHLDALVEMVNPTSDKKAYHLAAAIAKMLDDKGDANRKDTNPDLSEFWLNSNPNVVSLKRELDNLRTQVYYGDPYMVARNFGKGKVVAVMSTAGKDWNDWAGGPASEVLFVPFILETQAYLSSQGSEANLTVGTELDVSLDAAPFAGRPIKMMHTFLKPVDQEPAKKTSHGDSQFGKSDGVQVSFKLTKNLEPGVYMTELLDDSPAGKGLVARYAHAFNVDTVREGQLSRIGTEDLDRELFSKSKTREDPEGSIRMAVPGASDEQLIGKISDFSESPWLFLILLLVLVSEQALAVHLSFHLKASDDAAAVPTLRVAKTAA